MIFYLKNNMQTLGYRKLFELWLYAETVLDITYNRIPLNTK